MLAAGDAGGTVTVWDLMRRVPRSYCRGSKYALHAVAISPDGAILASCGRLHVRVWDVATGRELLRLGVRNWSFDIKFSPDGKQLAVASAQAGDAKGGVDLWQLENGRGVRQLRGLAGATEKTAFSVDGRLLAASLTIGKWAYGMSPPVNC